jgi:hypothetical protein
MPCYITCYVYRMLWKAFVCFISKASGYNDITLTPPPFRGGYVILLYNARALGRGIVKGEGKWIINTVLRT